MACVSRPAAEHAAMPLLTWKLTRVLRASLLASAALVGGCALFPDWRWEKEGASPAEYDYDIKLCKQLIYPGVDGYVTKESVRRMEACMMSRGWRKAPN
jgi:hypothetical protein